MTLPEQLRRCKPCSPRLIASEKLLSPICGRVIEKTPLGNSGLPLNATVLEASDDPIVHCGLTAAYLSCDVWQRFALLVQVINDTALLRGQLRHAENA